MDTGRPETKQPASGSSETTLVKESQSASILIANLRKLNKNEYIRYLFRVGLSNKELAKEFNLSHQRITAIVRKNGRRKD